MSLQDSFATPVLWYPGQSEDELHWEISQQVKRALVTDAWLKGKLSNEDFLDCLYQHQIDIESLTEDWDDGFTYG